MKQLNNEEIQFLDEDINKLGSITIKIQVALSGLIYDFLQIFDKDIETNIEVAVNFDSGLRILNVIRIYMDDSTIEPMVEFDNGEIILWSELNIFSMDMIVSVIYMKIKEEQLYQQYSNSKS